MSEHQAEDPRAASDEHAQADQLRVGRADRPAPEGVPPQHDELHRNEERGQADELIGELGEKGADSAGQIDGGATPSGLKNQTASPVSYVARETSQTRAPAKKATPTVSLTRRDNVVAITDQISMMTGSTSGRRPLRLRRNRCNSTRTRSPMTP